MTRLTAALAVGLVLTACGGAAGTPSSSTTGGSRVTVFAASSLTEVFPRIDPQARYSFAGSDQLALQIEEGAPADVFASASPRYPDELRAKGLVERPRVFATNRLVLIVPTSDPAGIHSVADLNGPGIKLVVGAPGVPVGDYTRQVLGALGQTAVLDRVVSEEQDVKAVASKVALGEADAGFVYATDVRPVSDQVTTIELPDRAQPQVEYEIAVVSSTSQRDAAEAFVRRVLSPEGKAELAAVGFGLP